VAERWRLAWAVATLALGACLCSAPPSASALERDVIGHSVQGRPIVLIRNAAADAAVKVLVVGDTHGNEQAGMRVTRRLVERDTPAEVELLVVPTINPDGVVARIRGNAHGVDLNRNFPFGWRLLTGGEYSGPRPLSEPESRAAQRLILRERPDVTIWFHQPFGLVDRPNGNPFAALRFADLIDLPLVRLPGPYPGSISRWQNHRFPTATAFVVELPQRVNSSLIRRGTAAVLTLASELASPGVRPLRRVAS
jgi:protein MpaA